MGTGRLLLAALAGVGLLAPAASAALVSQGAVRMGADALWSRGHLGAGQSVAVLDEGFAGLDRSIALGELPPAGELVMRSFDPANGIDGRTGLGLPTQHGVRMAEIIHDIAPRARLVLVQYRTEEQFAEAARWVAAQGIPIVSHSNSFLTPPFDGTGAAARVVDEAAAAGVLWVNSAGNYAQRRWRGRARPTAEVPVAPRPGDVLALSLTWAEPAVSASVAAERRDPGGPWTEAGRSAPAGPLNAVLDPLPTAGGEWRLVVRQEAGPPADLSLFSQTVGFGDLAAPNGSIPTPGDAAGALTVGAVKWNETRLTAYSSRGPTADGRMKPDLVGPTYVTSNPEWPGTAGTSASTAHVAGAAALLREARLAAGAPAGAADLRADLVGGALDLGPRGPDPLYGAGMARLDRTAPDVRLWLSAGPRRLLRVRVRDEGTLRRVEVRLGGRLVRATRRPSLRLAIRPRPGARERLVVTAEDMAGNVGRRGRWVRGRSR